MVIGETIARNVEVFPEISVIGVEITKRNEPCWLLSQVLAHTASNTSFVRVKEALFPFRWRQSADNWLNNEAFRQP